MMKSIRHGLIWLYLLTKRLLKKPVFIVTLILIPVLVFAMSIVADDESSMVRVALYTEDDDATALRVIDSLMAVEESVVHFEVYPDGDSAIDAVKNGKIDSAWGFTENFSEKLKRYADSLIKQDVLVRISEQEENVLLRLARERLYGALMPTLSNEIYKAYLADELEFDTEANAEELNDIYESSRRDNQLITFEFIDDDTPVTSINYLSTPLRGMVAVVMMICGMAAAMVFLHEKEEGIYSYLSERKQLPVLAASCFGALVVCSVVALIAMAISGNFNGIFQEIGLMVLYVLMSTVFCTLIAQICQKASRLAVFLPILVVLLLVFCPVFLNHKVCRPLQYCLPTYYYLRAVTYDQYISMMPIYTVVCSALCVLVSELSKLKPRWSRKK